MTFIMTSELTPFCLLVYKYLTIVTNSSQNHQQTMAHHGKTSNTSPSQAHTGVLHGNFDILFNWLRALGVCFKIM